MENRISEIATVKEHVNRFLNDTMDARELSERDRDYYDHKQWTEAEAAKLRARNQAPIVVNRIKPKVEGLVGLYLLRQTDPKAYPRTKKHEQASHAITDALRYVADNNDLQDVKMEVATDFFVEGYGGAITDVRQKKNGEIEIRVARIPWDRIYFDPHSREKDFEDARYMGMMLWMGEDQVREMFPDANVDELMVNNHEVDETFEDRPRWVDSQRGRIRLAYHFYIQDGVWHYCMFSGDTFLIEPVESPFLDDDGEPSNPIELVSANVDRDNARYGEVRAFISQQDEINHRRSKFLHMLSQRQTFGRQGAVKDVNKMKREFAKADGHIEFQGEEFGKDFGVVPTGDMAQGQVLLYQDAKGELDAVSFNAQLAGERQSGDLSGKAIDKLQQAGTIELNRQYTLLSGWEKRIYRQIWARIKQFWNEEKWIRVTDDQDNLRWVGLNSQVTVQQLLEETINDESQSLEARTGASFVFQGMMQAQDPRLQQIIETRNDTSQLDVDIILEQSFDVINIQQEQFQTLAQFAQTSKDIDIIELIELSQIRGKDELIEKIEARRAQAAQAQGNIQQIQAQDAQARMRKTMAEASNKEQEAVQKRIQNEILVMQPMDTDPQIVT